jgi:hypothetical protein
MTTHPLKLTGVGMLAVPRATMASNAPRLAALAEKIRFKVSHFASVEDEFAAGGIQSSRHQTSTRPRATAETTSNREALAVGSPEGDACGVAVAEGTTYSALSRGIAADGNPLAASAR